ncbi:MAG TPA: serine/threonine-protein kinase [Nannocystaceae bacterium]|nr:serine/threonine-protein kinase [Nannocystaceae bacterium]
MQGDDTLSGADTPGPYDPAREQPAVRPLRKNPARGDSIGRYLVLRAIGSGATGSVYAAWDPELDRRLAVKLLHPGEGKADDDRRALLLREAKALARLDHPNIISIHDVGEHDGRVFLAMDFIDGETLARWQTRLRPGWERVLGTYAQAGRGLAAVHAAGIVHRDFKPQNALVDARGRVRIVDFGLAASAGSELAGRDRQAGTPAYMAAELHTGGVAGQAADQFAFCVALYEALYLQHPFAGDSPLERAAAVLSGRIVPPPTGSKVPSRIGAAIQRGLARNPAERWPSLDALLDALEQRPRQLWRPVLGVSVGLVLVVGLIAVRLARGHEEQCGDDGVRLGELWNDARKRSIADAFASGPPWARANVEHVAGLVDAWSERHVATQRDACDASDPLEPAARAAIDACLARGLDHLEALLERWAEPDAPALRTAITAARELPDPARCGEPQVLQHSVGGDDDPDVQRRLDRGLARVHASIDSGALQAARESAEQLLVTAQDRHLAAQAETRVLLGRVDAHAGDDASAERHLAQGYFRAIAAHRDELACEAARELVAVLGISQLQSNKALTWAEHAGALADRIDEPLVRGRLAHLRGRVHARFDRHADALVELERARELLDAARGPDDLDTADALADLAVTQARTRMPTARDGIATAFATAAAVLGEGHPELARYRARRGVIAWLAGDAAGARVDLEQAAAELERELGADHLGLAEIWLALGTMAFDRNELPIATRELERAKAVLERRYGASHRALAPALVGLAGVAVAQGDAQRAIELAERAIAAMGGDHGPSEEVPDLPGESARAQAMLAVALHARDPADPRALELARVARRRLLEVGAPAWIITRTSEVIAARVGATP